LATTEKKIFLHIGLPKCASTTIQGLLSRCDDIDYVGMQLEKKDGILWDNEDFAVLFDRVLRFSCDNEIYWKGIIDNYIQESKKDIIVFSSENISLRFLAWDVPTHLKLAFIKKIFPSNTQFIYIYKNPLAILVSLYKEWVLMGYNESFRHFCDELYSFKEISLFNDILLDNLLSNSLFNKHNFHLIYLNSNLKAHLEELLNIRLVDSENKNKSIDLSDTEIIRSYNGKVNDYQSFFDSIEMHRAYFNLDNSDHKYALSRKRLIRKNVAKTLKPFSTEPLPLNQIQVSQKVMDTIVNALLNAKMMLKEKEKITVIDQYIEEVKHGKF
jgi:hypothetical protein